MIRGYVIGNSRCMYDFFSSNYILNIILLQLNDAKSFSLLSCYIKSFSKRSNSALFNINIEHQLSQNNGQLTQK